MADHTEYTVSIHYDRRLYRQDIAGSKAHAAMLAKQGIITQDDADSIIAGLGKVQAEIESGEFPWDPALEDLHMNIERRLTELIGPAGGRLHTGRSRNDQIALDMRLYTRRSSPRLSWPGLRGVQRALTQLARAVSRRRGHARLHPPAARAAGAVRPSHAGLLRDVPAGHRALDRLR